MTSRPMWVHVPGPTGPTTVQLSLAWLASVKARAGRGWGEDYAPVLVKSAASKLVAGGYDAMRDGAFSQAVRRRAYELAMQRESQVQVAEHERRRCTAPGEPGVRVAGCHRCDGGPQEVPTFLGLVIGR
jgi:hypothetical protein